MLRKVLLIGESDPLGVSGIQGDAFALGHFDVEILSVNTAVITPMQDKSNGLSFMPMPLEVVQDQMNTIVEHKKKEVKVIKVGFLPNEKVAKFITKTLTKHFPEVPVIYNPLTIAGGKQLLDSKTMNELRRHFSVSSNLIVLNIPEAEFLTGMEINTAEDMDQAGHMLVTMGNREVFIAGGHKMNAELSFDFFINNSTSEMFQAPKFEPVFDYGSTYALSAVIAGGLARRKSLHDAVVEAREYVIDNLRRNEEARTEGAYSA